MKKRKVDSKKTPCIADVLDGLIENGTLDNNLQLIKTDKESNKRKKSEEDSSEKVESKIVDNRPPKKRLLHLQPTSIVELPLNVTQEIPHPDFPS